MTLTLVGFVFGPLLMLIAAVFLLQGKGRRVLVLTSGVLIFLAALFMLLRPAELLWAHVPQILWKLLTLATAMFLFLLSLRDKHIILSVLAFLQILALVLIEILVSPDEPTEFLQFTAEGKLLFLAGTLVFAIMLPAILNHPGVQAFNKGRHSKAFYAGLFLWMSAFAGMICARSITGLFLFAQWGYLGNLFISKAFGQSKKVQLVPVLQQSALTLWISASVFIYLNQGTLEVAGLTKDGSAAGLLPVLVFMLVSTLGSLIPEKLMIRNSFSWPVSVMGLSMVLFSLIVPFSVLLKFRPLFVNLDHKLTSPVVFIGALFMAANAYHAGTARSEEELLSHVVLFVSGWGVASAFTGLEGVFFTIGYILAAALATAFLFTVVSVQKATEPHSGSERRRGLAGFLTRFKAVTLLLFLLPPFSCAMPVLMVIPMLTEYSLSMLVAVVGLVLMTAVIVRWILPMMQAGKPSDVANYPLPGLFRYVIPTFFAVTVAVNLLSRPIYRFLQGQPQTMGVRPAADLWEYAGVQRSGMNSISVFLGLSLIILGALYFITGKNSRAEEDDIPSTAAAPYSMTSWLPSGIRISLWIRAAWITSATLLVGVALSCLKQ